MFQPAPVTIATWSVSVFALLSLIKRWALRAAAYPARRRCTRLELSTAYPTLTATMPRVQAINELFEKNLVRDLGPLPAPRLAVNATVHHALQMLGRARRGAVVVLDDSHPVGIFSERDVAYRMSGGLFNARSPGRLTPLREVMSQPLTTIRRSDRLSDAIALMVEKDLRHLVVVDDANELRGLLTTADLLQFLTDQFPEQVVHLPPGLRQQFHRPEGA